MAINLLFDVIPKLSGSKTILLRHCLVKQCLFKLRYFLFSLKDDSTLFLIYLTLKSILALILIFLFDWAFIKPIFGVDFDS